MAEYNVYPVDPTRGICWRGKFPTSDLAFPVLLAVPNVNAISQPLIISLLPHWQVAFPIVEGGDRG